MIEPNPNAPRIEWSGYLADLGRTTGAFKVFPCRPDNGARDEKGNLMCKRPRFRGWQEAASWDRKTVQAVWMNWGDSNIGLAVQRGFVVLDADLYKPGNEALLAEFEATYGKLPDTMEFASASGGRHLIYTTGRLLGNSIGSLPKFGDVRGFGGYIVGPGSTAEGKPYALVDTDPPVALPKHVDDCLVERRERTAADRELPAGVTLDDPTNIARYTIWLREKALTGDEDDHQNDKLAAAAAMGSSYGLSEDETVGLLVEHFNPRLADPWDPEKIEYHGGSGYRSANSKFGNMCEPKLFKDETVRSVVALVPKPDAPDAPRRLLMGDDMWSILTETPPEIVKGIIGVGTLTVVSGGMGAGKSAWVSSVTHAVLTGAEWFGRETQQGRVMILAGEGTRRTIHDFAANCLHNGQDHRAIQHNGFAVHNGALLLNTPAGITTALERLEEFKVHFGAYPDVLVIDTARKNFRGSVSDDKDVGVFYEHVNLILGMGISVVVVAHTGKTQPGAASSGAKGSSDWEQGADYVLQMTGKVRDGETTIFFEKVKTGQDGDTITMGYVFPDVPGAGTTPVAVPKTGTGKSIPFAPVKGAARDTATQDNAKHKIAEAAITYVLSTNPSKPHSWRELSIAAAHYLAEQKQAGYTDDSIRNTHLKRMSNAGHPFYQRPTGKWRHVTQH